jgi:hypothetical protein
MEPVVTRVIGRASLAAARSDRPTPREISRLSSSIWVRRMLPTPSPLEPVLLMRFFVWTS